jgi:hypothetical protein
LVKTYPELQVSITVAEVQVAAFGPQAVQVEVPEVVYKKYPAAQAEIAVVYGLN